MTKKEFGVIILRALADAHRDSIIALSTLDDRASTKDVLITYSRSFAASLSLAADMLEKEQTIA